MTEQQERRWGTLWLDGLVILDVVAVLVGLVVLVTVVQAPNSQTIVQESTTSTAGIAGKVSFSRVIGLIGGISAFGFVGFITNVCLSHLFLTGKMPDQLGTTYAAAVGTLFTAFVPYVTNKAFTK